MVRERERQRQKSLQIDGIVLAAPGTGVEWGRGGSPSREERGGGKWHEPRETRPQCGHPMRPKPPSPTPAPQHTRETRAPHPTQITRGDTVSPSPRADTPPGNPMGETQSPLPEKSRVEMPPKRLSLGRHRPTKHQETAPTQGRNGSRGRALRRERYPRAPGRKDSSELPSLIRSAAGQRHPWGRGAGRARNISSQTCFRDCPLPWEERWPKTDMP